MSTERVKNIKQIIALLTFDFYPDIGGVQTYLFEIFRRLTDRYEIYLLTPKSQEKCESIFPFRRIIANKNPFHIYRNLKSINPEYVIVGHAHPQLLLPAALHGPYSLFAYGNDFLAAQSRWHRPLFNFLVRRAAPLITISKASDHMLRLRNLASDRIIYPGTDPAFFTPPNEPASQPILLSVGRLVPRKGIDTAIAALQDLVGQYPTLEYQIAGTGPDQDRLQGLARAFGVENHVRFLGRVPQEALPDLYRQAAIFVLPVREEKSARSFEGFGIVFLEASASGLPVIAGRSGGAVEAVQDGKTGILIPPEDPGALSQAVRRLLENPGERKTMGAHGREWVETTMNWDRAAEELAEVLRF